MNLVQSSRKQWTFTIIENAVLETEELDIYQKMTYISLCKFADKSDFRSFPSVNTLSKIVGASDRKITNVLKELVEKNCITIEFRNQKTSVYTLLEFPFMVNTVRVGGEHGAGRVVNTVRVGGEHGADELELYNKNHSNKNKDISVLTLERFETWWNVYKKKKDKPKAQAAFNRIIKKHGYEILLAKTKEYVSGFGSDDTYKKYPLTFLNSFDPDNDYSNNKKGNGKDRKKLIFEQPEKDDDFVFTEEERLAILAGVGIKE